MRNTMKIISGILILVIGCTCLVGCSMNNVTINIIQRNLSKAEAYVDSCDKEDFFLSSEFIKNSGNTIIVDNTGEIYGVETLPEDICNELKAFFQKHPDITRIFFYNDNEIRFWNDDIKCYVIICEGTLPDISKTDPYDYVRAETEDAILYISDHRDDDDSYDRHMYYAFGFKKVDDKLWVGYQWTKSPWYSFFFV